MLQEILQEIGLAIARALGQGFGIILRSLLAIFLVYLVWGLPWHNIFIRAGFPRQGVLLRLGLIMWPWFAFIITETNSLPSWLYETLGITAILSIYVTLLSVAIPKWPVSKQLEKTSEPRL